jgi:hypothetical protein
MEVNWRETREIGAYVATMPMRPTSRGRITDITAIGVTSAHQ